VTVEIEADAPDDEATEALPDAANNLELTDNSWRDAASKFDGRRRRRQGAIVLAVALASAGGGVLIGRSIKSPADEAADRAAPLASRIVVPVERQLLSSSLVLSGEVRFNEPTPIKLAGSVGVEAGEAAVITRVPEIDQLIQEGDAIFDVTSRPVFTLQGELPMYRSLAAGSQGPDVRQLEQALSRLGFSPGTVDNIFDEATEQAVSAFYTEKGYDAEGPSQAERDQLRAARQAVTDAEEALRTAQKDLTLQADTRTPSELLQLDQALEAAEAAVPAAERAAARANESAAQELQTATVSRDTKRTLRDSAAVLLNAAKIPGAIDVNTGEPHNAESIAFLETDLALAEEELARAEADVVAAVSNQEAVRSQGAADLKSAIDNRTLQRLQYDESTAPADTTAAQAAVAQADANVTAARDDLAVLDSEIGIRISPGEIIFVPILPSTVTELSAVPGSPTTDQLGTLSTADTLVSARVSRADSGLVTVGATVTLEIRDTSVETTGTVLSVGQPREETDPSLGGEQGGGNTGSGSGRLEVLIAPDDAALLRDFVFYSARVRIDIASTDGEVLVVPVAALSVGPGGDSRVEIETRAVTDNDPGATETVEVEVGLTAQGLVEIVSKTIKEGDLVVVGSESNERRNRDESGDASSDG
jgi:peptidoglycan hydrolase-like protein with peptidoglycan-binding domain